MSDKDEVQLFFCTITAQFCLYLLLSDEYSNADQELTTGVIECFYRYIDHEICRTARSTWPIFGGEPLLNSPKQKELIAYLAEESHESNLSLFRDKRILIGLSTSYPEKCTKSVKTRWRLTEKELYMMLAVSLKEVAQLW